MVRKVGVQAHGAPIPGAIDAGDLVPGGARRIAGEAHVALAAELDRRRAHVDRDGSGARPVRCRQISAAASAAAAIVVCAAAPTRNEEGSAGSAPVSVTRASAAGSPAAEDQRSARICAGDAPSVGFALMREHSTPAP